MRVSFPVYLRLPPLLDSTPMSYLFFLNYSISFLYLSSSFSISKTHPYPIQYHLFFLSLFFSFLLTCIQFLGLYWYPSTFLPSLSLLISSFLPPLLLLLPYIQLSGSYSHPTNIFPYSLSILSSLSPSLYLTSRTHITPSLPFFSSSLSIINHLNSITCAIPTLPPSPSTFPFLPTLKFYTFLVSSAISTSASVIVQAESFVGEPRKQSQCHFEPEETQGERASCPISAGRCIFAPSVCQVFCFASCCGSGLLFLVNFSLHLSFYLFNRVASSLVASRSLSLSVSRSFLLCNLYFLYFYSASFSTSLLPRS